METSGVYHFQVKWQLDRFFPQSQVIIMNSTDLSKLINRTRKSDNVDATKLAQIARYEELLKLSYCPPRDQAYLREHTRQWLKIIGDTVKIKNRIKKILSVYGCSWAFDYKTKSEMTLLTDFLHSTDPFPTFIREREDLSSKKQQELEVWGAFNPSPEERTMLLFFFYQLSIRQMELKLIEARVFQLTKNDEKLGKAAQLIQDIPGLGVLNNISLLTEIGDIRRFLTPGKFVVYCGIGPRGGTSCPLEIGSTEEKVVQKDQPNHKCNKFLKKIRKS